MHFVFRLNSIMLLLLFNDNNNINRQGSLRGHGWKIQQSNPGNVKDDKEI